MSAKKILPTSATRTAINFIGLITGLFSAYCLSQTSLAYSTQALAIVVCTFAPIILFDVVVAGVHRNIETGLDWNLRQPFNPARTATKLLGLAATAMLLAMVYYSVPEYANDIYQPGWQLLALLCPFIAALLLTYFILIDRYQIDPCDAYWYLGECCQGRYHPGCWPILKQHFLGWMIKGFFFPLMFASLILVLQTIQIQMANIDFTDDLVVFSSAWMLIFLVDLIFVSGGYVLTLRLLNAHIRSADTSLLAWCFALICYRPFWDFIHSRYLDYNLDGLDWHSWLAGMPFVHSLWATAIIVLLMIYLWSTVCFGYHFSNLTRRGIVTNGPYRFSKHPAYIAKNISWWMITVPFVSTQGWVVITTSCLALFCVNAIYFMRALSEEYHLLKDPTYAAYSAWIAKHGLFAQARKGFLYGHKIFSRSDRDIRV